MADNGQQPVASDRPWIFVHIQRTGGNAVRAALGLDEKPPDKHFLARQLRAVYGETRWERCFKFAFVRNPWDRLVSWWSVIDNYRDDAGADPAPNRFFGYVFARARSFEEFLANCTDEIVDNDGSKYIFRNQLDYLTDDTGGLIVDFVGRFERLQTDFDRVTTRLGLPHIQLPKVNDSRHARYVEYYTPAMAEKVRRQFHRDIEAFGYQFRE